MLKPNQIRGRLIEKGIVFRHEAEKLSINEGTFNSVMAGRCVSVRVQEHIAGLLGKTPQEVFGHFYRPDRARPRNTNLAKNFA